MKIWSAQIFTLIIALPAVPGAPHLGARVWNRSLWKLISDVLNNHLPSCELLLLQDYYFAGNMNEWLVDFHYPYYSVTMDGKPFPDYYGWRQIAKTAGFTCTNIIATCLSFQSCDTDNSDELLNMMQVNSMLLKERRALLYVDEVAVSHADSRNNLILNATTRWKFTKQPVTYQEQDVRVYTIPSLNLAQQILRGLGTHITIVRKLSSQADIQQQKEIYYETTTFSPNWIPGGTPVLRNIWSSDRGFSFPSSLVISHKNIRHGGKVRLCAASTDFLPMLFVKDGQIRGIDGEMIKIFQRRFGLQVEIFQVDGNDTGKVEEDGNWTGVIGCIVRREADFGIGRITFTQDRFVSGLRFTPAFVVISAIAVCPIPKLLPRFASLIQPYDKLAWLCIAFSAMSAVTATKFIQFIALKFTTRYRVPGRHNSVCWMSIAAPILQQSVHLNGLPRFWAPLGLMGIWLLLAYLLSCSYTSILIGALTVPGREAKVVSPHDLVTRKIPFLIAPIVEKTIQQSPILDERLMQQRAVTHNNDSGSGSFEAPDMQVFSFARKTRSCAVAEKLRTLYAMGQGGNKSDTRRLYISRDMILIGPVGWAMRSDIDFILEDYFDSAFQQFRAFGLLAKTMADFNRWNERSTDQGSDSFEQISLQTMEPVFIIVVGGLSFSAFVFIVELAIHRLKTLCARSPHIHTDPNIVP